MKATSHANSSSLPSRPSGTVPATPSTTGRGYLVRSVSVSKCPAASAVSRMLKRDHSIESTLVRFSTAARAAEECAIPGSPWWGERVTFTILPPRCSGIIALVATAWLISQVPSTFRVITVRKPLGVMSSAGVMYCPPALFTSTSIRPCRSITSSTSAWTWPSSRMSHWSASTAPCARAAVSSSGSSRRPQTVTVAPQAASSSAVARPSPLPPPLTIATWPWSRPGAKIFEAIARRLNRANPPAVEEQARAPAQDRPHRPEVPEPGQRPEHDHPTAHRHVDGAVPVEFGHAAAPLTPPLLRREVRGECDQLGLGARGQGGLNPLLELLRLEPPLGGGAAEPVDGAIAIAVCNADVAHVCLPKKSPWKPNGIRCGASARASSSNEAASSTRRNEGPLVASRTTDRIAPSSSARPSGAATS